MAGRTEATSDWAEHTGTVEQGQSRAPLPGVCSSVPTVKCVEISLIHDLESGAGVGHRFERFLALVQRYAESGAMDHVLRGLLIGPAPQASRIERMQIN